MYLLPLNGVWIVAEGAHHQEESVNMIALAERIALNETIML